MFPTKVLILEVLEVTLCLLCELGFIDCRLNVVFSAFFNSF